MESLHIIKDYFRHIRCLLWLPRSKPPILRYLPLKRTGERPTRSRSWLSTHDAQVGVMRLLHYIYVQVLLERGNENLSRRGRNDLECATRRERRACELAGLAAQLATPA